MLYNDSQIDVETYRPSTENGSLALADLDSWAPSEVEIVAPYSILDLAWEAGYTAALEDGFGACMPAGLTYGQARAWSRGAEQCMIGDGPIVADWSDEDFERLHEQDLLEDARQCGLAS